MNNYNYRSYLINSSRVAVALCVLAAMGGRAAQTQATIVTAPSQLISPVQTASYPAPSGNGSIIPSAFSVAAGSNTLTFTATNGTTSGGFASYVADMTVGPQFTAGNVLEETFNDQNQTSPTATAPLQIDFQQGVSGFGLFAQNANADTETFTLTVLNGNTSLGSFTFGPTDNSTAPAGTAIFVGAQSNAATPITRATLSSSSTGGSSNDFYFGPASVQPSLPCAGRGQAASPSLPCCAGLVAGRFNRCGSGRF